MPSYHPLLPKQASHMKEECFFFSVRGQKEASRDKTIENLAKYRENDSLLESNWKLFEF